MSDRKLLSINGIKPGKNKLLQAWRDIIEAISGTDKDFTEAPLKKAIFLLAVPMVLEMAMESIFAIVDIFFVSKLGPDAVATVGITESLLTLIYAIGIGLSMGTTALVSRRIGEKKPEEASNTAFQAIVTGMLASLVIAIPGSLYAKDLLILMGASDQMVEEGFAYPAILLGTNVVIMLLFIINAVFRSSGDAAVSMRVLWMANIINMILDPCLMFGWGPFPELGIKGAAIATSIGRGTAVLYQFYLLFKGKKRIRLHTDFIQIRWSLISRLVRVSLGGMFQNIIATSSWIGMVRIISMFGSEALAGYTIAIRIVIFSLLPSWGLSNAAATLVGQNLGAKKPERAEKSVWATGLVNMVMLGVIGVVFMLIPDFFIRLFTDDQKVIASGMDCLRIISYGFAFYGFGMVMVQAFNGAGDTRTPTIINLVCFWGMEIPLAYFLARVLHFGQNGVYFAIIIAESTLTLLSIYLFRKGTWKTEKV